MSKKKITILFVVLILVLVQLACDGGGVVDPIDQNAAQETITNALQDAADAVSDAAETLSEATPGSGCITYDLYESVTGKDIVDQSTCK